LSEDDFEMQTDFWKTFSIAPVFSVLHRETSSDWIKANLGDNSICIESADKEAASEELKSAYNQSVEAYNKKLEEDVRPAFSKFDKDGSGAIDKQELQALMKDLGSELDEEHLNIALKDLDTNKDGVVDFSEFKRWYFSGMKPYSGARRTLLRVGNKTKKILDTVKEEAKNALLCDELKTKTNKFSIGFNAPENPSTQIKWRLDMGGHDSQKLATFLFDNYKDTVDKEKETKRFSESWRRAKDDVFYIEIRFQVKAGSAATHANELNDLYAKFFALGPKDETEIYFKPKIHAIDDHTIAIG
jgi:hypothetical protein